MKFIITTHPIDTQLQKELGIYHDSEVKSISVGRVLDALAEKGYTKIHTFVENEKIHIHCKGEV